MSIRSVTMPLLLTLLGLLSLLHTRAFSAPTADTLSGGQVLAGDDKLISSNGKFALGFFRTEGTSADDTRPNRYYLGIWFLTVPKLTPVWVASRENPIADPTMVELAISGDGNLAILHRSDRTTNSSMAMIWSSQANVTTNNDTVAVLSNSGNLVLRSISNSSLVLWQSFDHPTDTLLPGAKIGRNKITGLNRRLVSNKNLADLAPGLYSQELGTGQSVVKIWNSSRAYWSTGEWTGQYFTAMPEMSGRTLFNFVFVNNDQEEYFMYTIVDETMLTYNLVDISGQTKQLVWLKGSQDWLPVYAQPKAQCDVYAVCGPNTICNDNIFPFCNCMKGFAIKSPQDWELNDRTGGCVRNMVLDCSSTDKFYPITDISLPDNAEFFEAAGSAAQCSQACISNCSCTAFSYSTRCSLWHVELLNIKQQQPNGNGGANAETLYLRLATKEMESFRNNRRGMIIGFTVGAGVVASCLLVCVLLMIIWKNKSGWSGSTLNNFQGGGGIVAFRYSDLQRATKNFSEKLGEGGFGSVFKGVCNSITIAVKRLDGARQGEKQFRAEVSSIGVIQHINLVKLIGFCCEGDRRLLVYEYMPNRSLDVHLFQNKATYMSWRTRYQIALGIAKALAYLHESCVDCIIHCDIKPQNILLDATFIPKIADFGMAKFVGRNFSRVLTTMRGTVGYLAPEWISGVAITPKVDVYSYGMVLLEIISGRRNSPQSPDDYTTGGDAIYFPVQVATKLLQGDVRSLVDSKLCDDVDFKEVEKTFSVACWCIQDDEVDRPTMGQVVQVLEGALELEMPPMPRFLQAITKSLSSVNSASLVIANN